MHMKVCSVVSFSVTEKCRVHKPINIRKNKLSAAHLQVILLFGIKVMHNTPWIDLSVVQCKKPASVGKSGLMTSRS